MDKLVGLVISLCRQLLHFVHCQCIPGEVLALTFTKCLCSETVVQEGDSKSSTSRRLPESLRGRFNFMTEILHLTVRAMNVGFLPAKNHYSKLQQ